MSYLQRPSIIPDNGAVMARQYHLNAFYGKLREVVTRHCGFDLAQTIPVKVECPDESQGLKTLYFVASFGTAPFVGRSVGAELDTSSIVPACHHGRNVVFVMGSHTGFDHRERMFGRLYREKEGGFSSCCGKLSGVIAPYMTEYAYAKKHIRVFRQDGKVFLDIPNRLLGIHSSIEPHPVKVRLKPSLVEGGMGGPGLMTEEKPRSVTFEIHPEVLRALEAKGRKISEEPAPLGDDLGPEDFDFLWVSSVPYPDDLTRRLHPLMHEIVSSLDYPPMVTIANVNTWIEFNRFIDAIHAIPEVVSKGIFGVSGLTVDLYFEDRSYRYSNVYYPQYAFFKPVGERHGVVMGPAEINRLLDSYPTPADRLSLDRVMQRNDEVNQEILFG